MNKLTEVSVKNDYKATCNHYRKLVYPLFLTLLVLLLTSSVQAKYSGGTGEPNTPYQIADANDMNEIGTHIEDWNDCFVLVNDINLAEYTGTQFNRIGTSSSNAFTGVFDGNGLTISNFTYTSNGTNGIGLFGYINDPNAIIKNLALIDPNVAAGTGDCVGPLVGRLKRGTIHNCSVQGGSSSGEWYVGGLVGQSYRDCAILNCYANAVVSGFRDVGGLTGQNQLRSVVSACYATGSVSGVGSGLGGLVGWNGSRISDCYTTANAFGTGNDIGGLVGINYLEGLISSCYAVGKVSGNFDTGGLVGENSGTIETSFWNIQTTEQSEGVGDGSPSGATGKTTLNMQKESTFSDVGWDFVEIWNIGENQTYPYLRVYPAGDLNHDGVVNWLDFAIFADHWLAGVE